MTTVLEAIKLWSNAGAPPEDLCATLGLDGESPIDETRDHTVVLHEDRFEIAHPIHERLDGTLLDCDLHDEVMSVALYWEEGTYRVSYTGSTDEGVAPYVWTRVS